MGLSTLVLRGQDYFQDKTNSGQDHITGACSAFSTTKTLGPVSRKSRNISGVFRVT